MVNARTVCVFSNSGYIQQQQQHKLSFSFVIYIWGYSVMLLFQNVHSLALIYYAYMCWMSETVTVLHLTMLLTRSSVHLLYPLVKNLCLALISCITSNVTAVPLVSTWWLLLTLSLRHLQGGNPIRWLRQGTQTCSHQTSPGGTPAQLLWAPGRHSNKPTLFQQICSGVGVGRRSGAPG